VVLADGQVLSELNTLRKNNTGYDLKQLFIGAEGTLGIITAAVLKLYPQPVRRQVALIGATDLPRLMQAFDRLRQRFDANLTAFELISPYAMQLVCGHLRCAHPWAHTPNLYSALIELSQTHNDDDTQSCLMPLNELLEQNLIEQAIVADSLAQAEHLWRLREQISAAQKAVGKNVKHDVSVPISAIATFIAATEAALEASYPGIQTVVFGHMGDGNVHFNVSAGAAFANADELMAHEEAINTIVYQQVEHHHGSISAEHGIGLLKKARMFDIKTPVELHLMRALKHTLDPHNLMNPHKVLPD
jgi:FAD/FMN-containing dehydrogenase